MPECAREQLAFQVYSRHLHHPQVAGGCAECAKFLQRLCGMLANLDRIPHAQTVWYVRCRLLFALLRAAIMCLRGSRSSYHRPVNALRELAAIEGRG